MSPILLVDLSGVYWCHWHATQDGPAAYQTTLEVLTNMVEFYPRMVICCEGKRPIRHAWFPEYKANRPLKPEDAVESLRQIIGELRTCPIPVLSIDAYEADDVIATLAAQATEPVCVLSRDKDLYALLSDNVSMIVNDRLIGPADCVAKFGVRPDQIRDYLAIVGDASDNIAGCPGIGAKGAAALLQRFGTLEAARAASDEELGLKPAALKKFRAWDPTLAVKLTTLLYDAPVHINDLFPNESENDMADMSKITTSRKGGPLKIVAYGPEGVGKTRFAAFSSKPIFLCAEQGLSAPDLKDVASFPAPDSWDDVTSAVKYLTTSQHDYRTLVIDSIDWLFQHVKADIQSREKMKPAEFEAYGRGEKFAIDSWNNLISLLDDLQAVKGMHVIVLGHCTSSVFQNPLGEDFARYQLALAKNAAERWKQWPDFLLFMSQEMFTKKSKDDKAAKGIIGDYRIFTTRSAAFDAKNRINLPTEIAYETANPWRPFIDTVKEIHQAAAPAPAKVDPANNKQESAPAA
jgi:5'-3' exonuclease